MKAYDERPKAADGEALELLQRFLMSLARDDLGSVVELLADFTGVVVEIFV